MSACLPVSVCDCLYFCLARARALLSHVATALKPPPLTLVLARTLLSSTNATSSNVYATSLNAYSRTYLAPDPTSAHAKDKAATQA